MATQCISRRCRQVSRELDRLLATVGLGDTRLVLAGFSQGAAIAAYTGLRRGCRGVLALGGPCPPRSSLLPDNDVTSICAVVGPADHCVSHEEIQQCIGERYAQRGEPDCAVHAIPGMGHVVSEESIRVGLDFLRRCGCT